LILLKPQRKPMNAKENHKAEKLAAQRLREQQEEQERLQDIMLSVENLLRHEEISLNLILSNLYEIGAVHLVNQKFPARSLNRFMKAIARMSKPVFRAYALRWIYQNCPLLLTNWLHSKVVPQPIAIAPESQPQSQPESQPVPALPSSESVQLQQEIKVLRRQVRILAGVSVGAIALLGSAIAWLGINGNLEFSPVSRQSAVRTERVVNQ
jgi:hypothetical protein